MGIAKTLSKRIAKRKLPNVDAPKVDDAALRQFLEGVKEHLRMYEGDSGAPKERFVTMEELETAGLVATRIHNGFAVITEANGGPVPVAKSESVTGGSQGGGGAGRKTLASLDDTSVSGIKAGEGIRWNGTVYVPTPLPKFDLAGTAKYDMLFRNTNSWDDTAGLLQWNPDLGYLRINGNTNVTGGYALTIFDSTDTDFAQFSHDGVDFNLTFSTTASWNISGVDVVEYAPNTGLYWNSLELVEYKPAAGDVSFSNVQVLCNFDGADGATAHTEQSNNAATVSFINSAQLDTAQSKFGSASLLLDKSTEDYVSVPDNAAFTIGTSDFTIEAWVRLATLPNSSGDSGYCVASHYDNSGNQRAWWFTFTTSDELQFGWSVNGTATQNIISTDAPALSTGQWYHVAVSRNGANLRLFIDGVELSASGDSISGDSLFNPNEALHIGSIQSTVGSQRWFDGWIDEFRFTVGTSRYNTGFTPPDAAFDAFTTTGAGLVLGDSSIDTTIDGATIIATADLYMQAAGVIVFEHVSVPARTVTMSLTGPSNTFETTFTATPSGWDLIDLDSLKLRDGAVLYIQDAGDTDYATFSHDGTDFNTVLVNTTDWNITGITAIQAGTVDADFDAITATSYGGITEANLLDKAAVEAVTGEWEFTSGLSVNGGVSDIGQVGQTAFMDVTAAVSRFGAYDWDTVAWQPLRVHGSTVDIRAQASLIEFTLSSTVALDIDGTTMDLYGGIDFHIRDAGLLRIYDATDTDYGQFSHDGTDFYAAFTNTADWQISGLARMELRSGVDLLVYGPGNTVNGTITHTDSNFQIVSSGASNMQLSAGGGFVNVISGNTLRVWDITNTDRVELSHDGAIFHYNHLNTASAVFETAGADRFVIDFTNDRIISYSPIFMQEQAAGNADTAAFGQLWVQDTAPNHLRFKDDTGRDKRISPNGTLNDIQYAANTAAFTLADSTSAQAVFPAAVDTFTLEANSTYEFEGTYLILTGTTSKTISMLFPLTTAVVSDINYVTRAWNGTASALSTTARHKRTDVTTAAVVTQANTSVNSVISFRGIMRVTTGGTVVPQIQFSAAPGATNQTLIGSYIKFTRLGSDTEQTTGGFA